MSMDEDNKWFERELDKELLERMADALQTLLDEQNGPPLIRRQKKWEKAVETAQRVLKAYEVDSSNVFTCSNCGHQYSDRRPCPECGTPLSK